jgi:hypothetical protein
MLYDEDDDVDAAAEQQSRRDAGLDEAHHDSDDDDGDRVRRVAGESSAVDRRPVLVPIDLALTAHANMRKL